MQNEDIDVILCEWSRNYGLGSPQWLGYPKTNVLHEKHGLGRIPEPTKQATQSDRVDAIVRNMDRTDYWKHACVLRCHYFAMSHTLEMRLDKLRKLGVSCTKDGYYKYLNSAKMTVDIGLRLAA